MRERLQGFRWSLLNDQGIKKKLLNVLSVLPDTFEPGKMFTKAVNLSELGYRMVWQAEEGRLHSPEETILHVRYSAT
jgi:hypothetical protein